MIKTIIDKIKKQVKKLPNIKKKSEDKFSINDSSSDILKIKQIDFSILDTKKFVDIPDAEPRVKLFIPKVGITQRPHYIKIIDPFKHSPININSFVKIFMPLKESKRGLHMSRIEKVLYSAQNKVYNSLSEYTEEIIVPIIREQNVKSGRIYVKSLYEKETDKNPSGRKCHEILYLYSITSFENNKLNTIVGLGAYFMNACPCPQRWAIRNFYYKLKEKGYSEKEIYEIIKEAPLESHTNRGIVNLFVEDKDISYRDLYKIIDSSVTIVRELLSGNDEHLFIREAHEKELFCEDVVREVAFNVVKYLGNKIENERRIIIKAEVDESIHFHNLYTEISLPMGELKKQLKNYFI
jgi:GTP cyclohydrolase FolE2